MKEKIKIILKKDFVKFILIALVFSLISSLTTYQILRKQIPNLISIDLQYLNNEFIVNLSKHQLDSGMSDDEVTNRVRAYSRNIGPLLDEISKKGNVILLQKQAMVSNVPDITREIEKTLINGISNNNTGK